jgi:transcriptional regulator with XRE-family HTH domain
MYEIFAKLLEEHNVTPYKVSKATGIAGSTFTDWKNGRSSPKQDKLQKIADFFGVPMSYLLTGEMEESVKETILSARDERDISRRLEQTLSDLEGQQSALMFDGAPLDDETKELLKASLEHSIRVAKINAKKFTNKRFQ